MPDNCEDTCFSRNKAGIVKIAFLIPTLVTLLSAISQGARQGPSTTSGPLTLTVTSHRPMADMLDKIQHLYGRPIDFEEVPYQCKGDLETRNVVLPSGPRQYVSPAERQFKLTLQPTDSSVYLAAQTAVAAYSEEGLPGSYKVVQPNGRVAVIPLQVREVNGLPVPVIPVTSRPLRFPVALRPALDTLQLALEQVATEAGVKVVLLSVHVPNSATIQIGASGESLGDFIADFCQKTAGGDCFRLLYEPNDKTYYLNLMSVGIVPALGYSEGGYLAPVPPLRPANKWFSTKTPQP